MNRAPATLALALALAAIVAGPPAAAQSVRSVVPIREVEIRPIGTPRYAIPITVNGVAMEAGLDTGSLGLRLLPRAVARAGMVATGPGYTYGYGSGVVLDGADAAATIRIGAAQGRIAVQAVRSVACRDDRPRCPAATLPSAQYGLMGSGQPDQGFAAIIGVRLQAGRIAHPLSALGVRRWIVHLPPRGGGAGTLILNPDAKDSAGFVPLRSGADRSGTVAGCVMVSRPDARRICGPTLWDTGAPGIGVTNAPRPPAWTDGVAAELRVFAADGSREPGVAFRAGDRDHGGQTTFAPAPRRTGTFVSAGTLPFYAYDMLYDATTGEMAIRPNPDQRDTPRAMP